MEEEILYAPMGSMKKVTALISPLFLFIGYGVVSLCLFLYSWTQVDLGMTLTQFSMWQTIQRWFQNIGYFQRPLSTTLYILLVVSLFLLYMVAMKSVREGKLTKASLRTLIIFIFALLILSYPAFSYDFFNYMFTAKTVLIYHKNPYAVVPLQFTGFEPWLSFMHWTHLPSAYAPLWILLTIPPYIFGYGYFLWILWNLKITIGMFYLFTCWGIGRILIKEKEIDRLSGVALFACNPLILIESLVSGHNDIVMIACAVIFLVFLWQKKPVLSFFSYALSVAFKEITIVLVLLYFVKNRWLPFILMTLALVFFLVFFRREMLPWYGIWIVPFAAIVPNTRFILPLTYGFSLGLLLYYIPFLYFGHWNDPVPVMKFWLTILPMIMALIYMITKHFCTYIYEKY